MSRLWPDKSCAVLCPDQLQVVRPARGWRRRAAFGFSETLAGEGDGPPWQAAVAALERFLATPGAGTGALDVVLSNHFVRYLLVPWSARIASAEELRNYAAAMFEEIHGEGSAQWDVIVSAERAGAPRLAAAVDRPLLESIRTTVAPTRMRLASIQPYLMAAYNRVARAHTGQDFVFMLLETGRACIVAAQGGRWCHVSTAAAPEPAQALASLLARELRWPTCRGRRRRPSTSMPRTGRAWSCPRSSVRRRG
ncbi:hypothetical protein [Ramlibacter montanisoli]|uniref:Uncharacterized protein n=1 Tax=Ramlibacter montanisoli TaxID=2732512 RepID=A0A849K8D2_9BURK|nr:hypothetical protein [Ramlibacter montanisoli]NNU42337.1 hypothetical protein [Ramlibacter montanisoli]